MKTVVMISLTLLFLILSTNSFAYENPDNMRDKMVNYMVMKRSLNPELTRLQVYMASEGEKFENDFSLMDLNTLSAYIEHQKQYLRAKQALTKKLYEIYFPNHPIKFNPFKDVVDEYKRKGKCTMWERISQLCFYKSKALVFEAQHLNQKISEIETIETNLTYAIADQIHQQDQDASSIYLSNTL